MTIILKRNFYSTKTIKMKRNEYYIKKIKKKTDYKKKKKKTLNVQSFILKSQEV